LSSTRSRDALSGAAAAALALGVSELAAGIFSSLPSLIEGVGNWVIDIVPESIKHWAISVFNTNDKLALLVGMTLVVILLGALVGMAARSHFGVAMAAFIGFGVLGALAASREPAVSLGTAMISGGLAALTGLVSLQWLLGLDTPVPVAEGVEQSANASRRSFIFGVSAVLGLAALSAGVGRVLLERGKVILAGRAQVVLPDAVEAVAPVPAAAEFTGISGLSPVVTPNASFYRIDAAFSVPRVDLPEWTLSIKGMVDRPYSINYADILDMPMVERYVTLSCVSNQVGGDLVGNAKWLGVPLTEILDRAVVQPDAEQIVGRSVDDFTVGFPVDVAYDGRDALLAVGMNDEPLPFEHGFPARLVVAGLYGYVSATKWISEIELTRWDDFDAYWVPRGWAKEAPVKTQSRIDTPASGAQVPLGPRQVAGVAWAPNRGISRVEVQLGEDSPWLDAELSEPLSDNSWRQWSIEWDAPLGTHRIRVRATDGEGEVQTEAIVPPAPNGASGWHTIETSVA
jgi:DMSO/TMAO reductase YedYZ molybdopterin-dependent catalytic subunit